MRKNWRLLVAGAELLPAGFLLWEMLNVQKHNGVVVVAQELLLAQISSPPLPEKLDISEVAKAADATLRRMGIASPSGEVFRKGTPVC